MKKYLFVINPVSGGTDKEQLISELKNTFCNDEIAFMYTTGTDDSETLDQEIKSLQPDVVGIAGGDGTINQLVITVAQNDKTLAIIPSGSANGLATDLGINLENISAIMKADHTLMMDIILINDLPMIHMADLGLNASLIKRYEQEERRGFLGYAVSAIQELPNINEQFEVSIESRDYLVKTHTSFLVIANSRRYGTGYLINPKGQINDGLFELCMMKELSPDSIFSSLFNEESNDNQNSIFEVQSVSSATIKLKQETNFQIDGEYMGTASTLHIRRHLRPVKVLTPPENY